MNASLAISILTGALLSASVVADNDAYVLPHQNATPRATEAPAFIPPIPLVPGPQPAATPEGFTIDAQGNVVIPSGDASRAMLEIPQVPKEF